MDDAFGSLYPPPQAVERHHVAAGDPQPRELRRHVGDVVRPRGVVYLHRPALPLAAAEGAPRHVLVTVALVGDEPVGEDALLLHHPDAAAERPRPRHLAVSTVSIP